MNFSTSTYKLSLKNCNNTEEELTSTPHSSVGMCAVQCMETDHCVSFASRGDDCRVMATCPKSCTEATGSGESWSIYCQEGKIRILYNFSHNFRYVGSDNY